MEVSLPISRIALIATASLLFTVKGAFAQVTYDKLILSHNPVAYWRLSEASGTVARDRMNAHEASYVGGVTLGQPGVYPPDRAASFNGINGKADRVYHPALNPAGSFSLVLWCRTTGGAGTYRSPVTNRMGGGAAGRGGYMLYAGIDNRW